MISENFAVNATAQKIVAADNINRHIYIHVMGNGIVYLGNSTVTSANGLPTEKHTAPIEIFLPEQEELWAIDGGLGENIRVLRPENG